MSYPRPYHVILDIEIIGKDTPVFLVVCNTVESGRIRHFWYEDRERFRKFAADPEITFVTFNGNNFDSLLIQAWLQDATPAALKRLATEIVEGGASGWQTRKANSLDESKLDWIDLIEPTPGVRLSLKIYEGRMHYPRLQDLPIHYDTDIAGDAEKMQMVLDYCINDTEATKALFHTVRQEIDLRVQMSKQYKIDLRSKSGAQIAQAVLCQEAGIKRNKDAKPPVSVEYQAPQFVQTDNPIILDLIERIQAHSFKINENNGSPEFPPFLKDPIQLGHGTYQFGIGGLHSQHDTKVHYQSTADTVITDWDVASFYPSIILAAGLVPDLDGGKGQKFLDTYRDLFNKRLAAKREGDKATANSLKLVLNSTFGKLGEQYCPFYAPDLLLAVTITGQLFLLTMIDKVERIEGVKCISANTDGITLQHPPQAAQAIADILKDTPFEWEDTHYREVAYRDVNSYVAITTDGKAKRKGVFGEAGVMQMGNPTFQISATAAAKWLQDRTPVEETVNACDDIREFVSIRNVTGGGIQHVYNIKCDDWELVENHDNANNRWFSKRLGKGVTRKSRPKPVEVGAGGIPFGRVARWYISTKNYRPIQYCTSGNKVPETDRAKLCLDLPTTMPSDVDRAWYISRAKDLLAAAGVTDFSTTGKDK